MRVHRIYLGDDPITTTGSGFSSYEARGQQKNKDGLYEQRTQCVFC
jgi:hypothetical protein